MEQANRSRFHIRSAAVKALIALGLVFGAIHHFSATDGVKSWQVRQAHRLECAVALANLDDALAGRYCVTEPGSAATSR
jgi:hypothetical protein